MQASAEFIKIASDSLWGKAVKPCSLIMAVFVLAGSMLKVYLVWRVSDLFDGLVWVPNLLALSALSGAVSKAADEK